ncbi:MAG: divalent-cation tolerance protein CutA [Candidatus Omnitrophota bacterium]|jgi:periplasmic divalent cation tolerance protein
MKIDFIIVYICCASRKEASAIAGQVVSNRLAACANIIPGIDSIFWWKGRIEKAKEVLLILKTTAVKFRELENTVKRIHSYELPEIIAVPVAAGSKDYLSWIKDSTGQ